jgi:hypothetical protein
MANVSVVFVFSQSSQFVALTGPNAQSGFCTPYLAVTDNGGGEVVPSGASAGSVTIGKTSFQMFPSQGPSSNPTTLTVSKNHQPKFNFSVVVPDPNNPSKFIPATSYALAGLALKKVGSNGVDLTTFPGLNVSVDKNSITTLSVDDKSSGNTSATYDFWIMVQNASGDVGLIDPLITNEQ